jgi:hypothetical protein
MTINLCNCNSNSTNGMLIWLMNDIAMLFVVRLLELSGNKRVGSAS